MGWGILQIPGETLFRGNQNPFRASKVFRWQFVDSDLELIQRTLAGEVDAFGRLVERYEPRLLRALVFRVGCWESARDTAQEAFVHAFTKLPSFQAESGFYTWLYRIAVNSSISQARKRRPLRLADASGQNGTEGVDHRHGPADLAERGEQVQQVRIAIQSLGEEHREIIHLREIEGLAYEQISELLKIPLGTVRSRLARAREQLKQTLAPHSDRLSQDGKAPPSKDGAHGVVAKSGAAGHGLKNEKE